MLAHDVFFTLQDASPAKIDGLVAACHKYLKVHPGVEFFAVGRVGEEFARPVNDRLYHVALHVYFTDKAAHDKYQEHADHVKFIEENKPNWRHVRVFDSWVER
jgi:hypothetical protein